MKISDTNESGDISLINSAINSADSDAAELGAAVGDSSYNEVSASDISDVGLTDDVSAQTVSSSEAATDEPLLFALDDEQYFIAGAFDQSADVNSSSEVTDGIQDSTDSEQEPSEEQFFLTFNDSDEADSSLHDSDVGEKKKEKGSGLFDFVELFVFTLAVVILLLSFVFRHSVVDGDSMQGTLNDGEHLIISDLFYSPRRSDIIVFEDYATELEKPIVKRIIAIEGDRVRIDATGVYVNGQRLDEDYILIDGPMLYTPIECVVPKGEVFVLGDHRNASTDSRVFGTIKEDAILGRVIFRFYPFDSFGAVN